MIKQARRSMQSHVRTAQLQNKEQTNLSLCVQANRGRQTSLMVNPFALALAPGHKVLVSHTINSMFIILAIG